MDKYLSAAKLLKSLGLIDYDLRRVLNNGQKARITRLKSHDLKNPYRNVVKYPKEWVRLKIPRIRDIKKTLIENNYINNGKYVWVDKHGYDKVRFGKKWGFNVLIRTLKSNNKQFKLKYQYDIIIPRTKIINALDMLASIKLPKGATVTAKINDHSPFSSAPFATLGDLAYYLINSWGGRDSSEALAAIAIIFYV